MKYKYILLLVLFFISNIIFAQLPDIVQLEYYFDTDPGFGNGTSVSISSDSIIDIDFNADLSAIAIGYHNLFVRVKDANHKWSHVYKQGVYKAGTPTAIVPLPDLTQMEYYFDTDPGFGNGFQIPFTADSLISVDFDADLSSVDVGYHKLFVRTKDENDKWSLIYMQGVYKAELPTTGQPLPDLVKMEYFFDLDPGFGLGTDIPITPDSLLNQDFNADMTSLSVGTHQLFVRVKDENHHWSLVYTEEIEKVNANQWQGTVDVDWNNAANWQFDIPISTENVSIDENMPRYPETNSGATAECNNLFINPGGSLIIPVNNAITISGNLLLSGDLSIKSDANGSGSLIEDGNPFVIGNLSAERFITASQWHGISSPLRGTNANAFYLNGNPDVWLKEWNETTEAYEYITDINTPLADMEGLFIWIGGAVDQTFSIVGDLRSGEIGADENLVRSAPSANSGWNYVGNPFTSAIDWNASAGWTKTNVDNTIYIYNSPNWATWNGSIATNGGSQYIAMGQGFFVNVSEGNSTGTLKMDNGVKVHNNVAFLKQVESLIDYQIRLELSGNSFKDETVILLSEGASEDFDNEIDAHKLFSFNTDVPQIYSTANDFMAVNALPLSTAEIPIDVRGADGSEMEISLTENTKLGNIFLKDNFTNIHTNLENETYTFKYISDITDRFTIYFTVVGLENNLIESFKIYSYKKEINVIIPQSQNAEIFIYNLTGQNIVHKKGQSGLNSISIDKIGYYVVKVVNSTSITTKNVFIN